MPLAADAGILDSGRARTLGWPAVVLRRRLPVRATRWTTIWACAESPDRALLFCLSWLLMPDLTASALAFLPSLWAPGQRRTVRARLARRSLGPADMHRPCPGRLAVWAVTLAGAHALAAAGG
jgi:hypothetical protein